MTTDERDLVRIEAIAGAIDPIWQERGKVEKQKRLTLALKSLRDADQEIARTERRTAP